ncbi:MAG: magnesium transporter CorA family protein [Gammaproteobacteria bacterium]
MLSIYEPAVRGLRKVTVIEEEDLHGKAVWLDLYQPTPAEELRVEKALGIDAPSWEEMQEIEVSSRLYTTEAGAIHLTATVLSGTETERPNSSAVTFILIGSKLVTLRYTEPMPFTTFSARVQRNGLGYQRAEYVLAGLLDAIIDRVADILERIGSDLDLLSLDVFEHPDMQPTKGRDFQRVLRQVGKLGDLTSKARESLVSIGRLLGFLNRPQQGSQQRYKPTKEMRVRIKTLSRDVQSLTDHASFLVNKINFLLDATLGMINIEQNAIIKIFSVAAVAFLPPTLIASIYGMNFHHMPELDWSFGYPLAISLMITSAVIPLIYFKRKRWL